MDFTIAICTFNRAARLRQTLNSLLGLIPVSGVTVEILVVDNGSTDETPEVVKAAAGGKLPMLRYIREAQQGVNHARNRALRDSTSEIVAFLDDDVEVAPRWMAALVSAFADHQAAIVGGRSYLIYEGARRSWISPRLEIMLSKCDYGSARLLNPRAGLFGLNYAVRRSVVLELGGFDVNFGRFANGLLSSEEVELQERVELAGGTVVYEPTAVVGHIVPTARLRQSWFIRRAYWQGVSDCMIDRKKRKPRMISASLVESIRCAGSFLLATITKFGSPHVPFERLLNAVREMGYLRAALATQTRRTA